jgi:hypothetical protein
MSTTLNQIHDEIDRLSEVRRDLWRELSQAFDPAVSAEVKQIDARLEELWAEHRAFRATLRFGERDRIIARARQEERLERAA